ncbi:MAG: IMPACT family protein [Clostridiales bacterium]|nr:IMPACT family protein [Clostridiales bacterium]
MTEYYIPTGPGDAEYVEKRSRFLGKVRSVASEAEARAFIDAMKKQYYDARHNCWCYLLRSGVMRYSDDGEPQGTAGQPMLEGFSRSGVTDTVCVVTRYFGGVLLGAGHLLRAYQGTAKLALDAAGISVVRRWVKVELACGYSLFQKLSLEVSAAGGVVTDTDYGADVTLRALLPEEQEAAFAAHILDVTAGTVRAVTVGETEQAVALETGKARQT